MINKNKNFSIKKLIKSLINYKIMEGKSLNQKFNLSSKISSNLKTKNLNLNGFSKFKIQ